MFSQFHQRLRPDPVSAKRSATIIGGDAMTKQSLRSEFDLIGDHFGHRCLEFKRKDAAMSDEKRRADTLCSSTVTSVFQPTRRVTLLPAVTSVFLPTGELDEKRAIDWTIALWKSTEADMKDRAWLRDDLQVGLREGGLEPAIFAIELAKNGSKICDTALRTVERELRPRLLLGEKLTMPGHRAVVSYVLEHPEHKRPPWRPELEFDLLVRDARICLLIDQVRRQFGVPISPSNREARRAVRRADRRGTRRDPSAISIVVAALRQLGLHPPTEESTRRNIWNGYIGNRLRARGIISA
jgi:hypothetical protein